MPLIFCILNLGRSLLCLFVCLMCFILPDPINFGAIPSSFSSLDAFGGLGNAGFRSRTLLFDNNKDQDELFQQSYLYDYCSYFVGYALRIVGFILSLCLYLYLKKSAIMHTSPQKMDQFRNKLMLARIDFQNENYDTALVFLKEALAVFNFHFYNFGPWVIFSITFSLIEAIVLNSRIWYLFTRIPLFNRVLTISLEKRKIVNEIYDCHHLIYMIVHRSNRKLGSLNVELHAFSFLCLFRESTPCVIFIHSQCNLYILFMSVLPQIIVKMNWFNFNPSLISGYTFSLFHNQSPENDTFEDIFQCEMLENSSPMLRKYYTYSSIWSVSIIDNLYSSIHTKLFCLEYQENLNNLLSKSHSQDSLKNLLSKFLHVANKYKLMQLTMSTSNYYVEDQHISWWSHVAIFAVLSKLYKTPEESNRRFVLSLPNSLLKIDSILPKSVALANKFYVESFEIKPFNFQNVLSLSIKARKCLSASITQDTPNELENSLYTLLHYLACDWLLSGLARMYSQSESQSNINMIFENYLHTMDLLDEVVTRSTPLSVPAMQHYLFMEEIKHAEANNYGLSY